MKKHFLLNLLLLIAFVIPTAFLNPYTTTDVNSQSSALSLITPYFGSKTIRSFFDHSYPIYGSNSCFVRFDGQAWSGDLGIETCTNSVNCYDGHNGLDVAMDYEPVLASSDGIVVEANYDIVSCHTCLYGLEIIIKHDVYGQIYRTRYAHLSALAVQVG